MNEQSTNLFKERSPATVDLDNLVRRKLKVSDPTNANEIAKALGKLYKAEKETMDREATGLPYTAVPFLKALPQAPTSSGGELDQAKKDVEHDLKALMTNSLLKDIRPELEGWASAIRTAVSNGVNAARFGLDPIQRDKTFSTRRLLGDYARVARFVGAMTPTLSLPYRHLAKSLDEVSGVLLVMMGENLANINFGGGKFLLQAPVSELQGRRDAVIFALRNLIGSTQEAYGPNDWPRGLQAYMQFIEQLEINAQHELRSLFQENELARIMDELIHSATGNTSEGYRALGSTAQIALGRFRRLIIFSQRLVRPESPPLAAFLSAVKLFLNAFANADSGYRLLPISRPPILFYGLYGIGGQDDASRRLLDLIIMRGKLADMLDCYMGCECNHMKAECQIILDKILYDVDRAIDLYALGRVEFGEPEQRAAAYGYVIESARVWIDNNTGDISICNKLITLLEDIRNSLWFYRFTSDDFKGVDECFRKYNPSQPSFSVLSQVFSVIDIDNIEVYFYDESTICGLRERLKLTKPNSTILSIYNYFPQWIQYSTEQKLSLKEFPEGLRRLETMLGIMRQELCIQRETEKHWRSILETMAPKCIKIHDAMDIIDEALLILGEGSTCPEYGVSIPANLETSNDAIAFGKRTQTGGQSSYYMPPQSGFQYGYYAPMGYPIWGYGGYLYGGIGGGAQTPSVTPAPGAETSGGITLGGISGFAPFAPGAPVDATAGLGQADSVSGGKKVQTAEAEGVEKQEPTDTAPLPEILRTAAAGPKSESILPQVPQEKSPAEKPKSQKPIKTAPAASVSAAETKAPTAQKKEATKSETNAPKEKEAEIEGKKPPKEGSQKSQTKESE